MYPGESSEDDQASHSMRWLPKRFADPGGVTKWSEYGDEFIPDR
jgi:hypothetical protein